MFGKPDRTSVFEFSSPKIISPLSFCCLINNRALANHFNEVYITERCVWSAVLRIAKTNKIWCERGRMSMVCIWKVLFGEIFPASQTSPRRTKESTSKIGFALINGRFCNGTDAVVAVWVCESSVWFLFFFTMRVYAWVVCLWMPAWQSSFVRESAETCHQPC